MGVPKITTLLISLIWISFIAFAITTFIANLNTNYGTQTYEDNLTTFNKLKALDSNISTYQKSTNIQENENILDKIGGYFSAAYQVLRSMTSTFDILFTMVNEGYRLVGLGHLGAPLKTAISLTIIVLIFIGVVVAAIVKRDL